MSDLDGPSLDPAVAADIRSSFARQGLMRHLGAELSVVRMGQIQVRLSHRTDLTQQHGYFHAGATSAIADTAGGYAALSVHPQGSDVLTVSLHLNLIAPARGNELVAVGTVVRAGRTLTTCSLRVSVNDGQSTTLVALGQQTIYRIRPRP
ncbi:PaaI family thioesterase [Mycobacterium sp. shizuoka-1]|uniref:PaaI family thioesterase n=1 Tax=Mycobacterium sp. shizuoka-1 TaxID=2039281 RepID=UPI000C0672C1|nr:PaaI family thioesterase [Mycobacterium sp. shizuoka-1]GAY14354.1 thioesterase [Mycobacterium sp. shizuoka-1]